jgi:predicted nucleic acid-binding protein
MILIDTNIIIDFWKKPTLEVGNILIAEKIAICGVVIAELIHGAL